MTNEQTTEATRDDPIILVGPVDEPRNVIQAVAAVMAEMGGIPKLTPDDRRRLGKSTGGEGGGGISYAYRSIDQIAAAAQPLLGRFGVVMAPEVLAHTTETVTIRDKPWSHHRMTVAYTVYGPGGVDDRISLVVVGEGLDNSDKGANKAQTMAYKNALLRLLCIGDPSDDADHGKFIVDDATKPNWWGGWFDQAEHDAEMNRVKAHTRASFGHDDQRNLATEFRERYGREKNPSGWPLTVEQLGEWEAYLAERLAQAAPEQPTEPAAYTDDPDSEPIDVGEKPTPESIAATLGGDLMTVGMPDTEKEPEPPAEPETKQKPGSRRPTETKETK